MPRILVQRRANVLVPITPHATKEVSKIADGDHIVVTINRGRSSRQNSFYHAILDKVAEGCGLKGVTVKTQAQLTEALRQSCEDQKKRITTFIEVVLNQELGEPFRRDAMKKPVVVAGIKREDMRLQQGV